MKIPSFTKKCPLTMTNNGYIQIIYVLSALYFEASLEKRKIVAGNSLNENILKHRG